jgi:4-amino-4-deoxy-L-arabinose transferase-like glycosyltransferase
VSGLRALLRDRWQNVAALILLVVLFAQLLGAATALSATIDEPFHITSGLEYLRTGRMQLFDEHVPLAKALFAWPLLFVDDLSPPEEAPGYTQGDLIGVTQSTLLAYRPLDPVIVACRTPVALLTVLLAATVYRWAAKWFGRSAGVVALVLFAFDPNILAHGSLATTDLGATAFIFWAVVAFTRFLDESTFRKRWWIAALALGFALGVKLTTLLLLPVLGLLALVDAWVNNETDRVRALFRRALSYAGMVAVAALVVWALFLFEVRPLHEVAGGQLPIPAASYVERWLRLQVNIDYGREAFLLGQNRMHGWWQYFPVAFLVKTPLPTLILALMALVALALGKRRPLRDELVLALFPLTYGLFSLTSTINIGYRHLLPILPFLFIGMGRIANCELRIAIRGSKPLIVAFLIWLTVGTILISPHYLAYFNALAGGPDGGYRFLADSNTDWGQTLKALADYQRESDLGSVRLSIFTFLDPAAYGVEYEPIAPMEGAAPVLPRRFNPAPGTYAISATTLDGVPLPLPSTYDWFRHREPVARVGHAMFIYQVPESEGEWVAQCTDPVTPLTTEAITEGFGREGLRHIVSDCTHSWVFPDEGRSTGWVARATPSIDRLRWPTESDYLDWLPGWAINLPLDALHLSYAQPAPGTLPAFAMWEWEGAPVAPPTPAEEIVLDETLAFLGYALPESTAPGTSVDVVTFWRVVGLPARPLSLMLHLTATDGTPIAVGDGLGVPVGEWQIDDIVAQRHTLSIPAEAQPGHYTIQTGAYWLDTMDRWTEAGAFDPPFLSTELEIEP